MPYEHIKIPVALSLPIIEMFIALCLPLSVLIVGAFTVWVANKRRNDDMFDKQYELYEKVSHVWDWRLKAEKGKLRKTFPPNKIKWEELSHIHKKADFLFDDEIEFKVKLLIDEARSMADAIDCFNRGDEFSWPQQPFNENQFNEIRWRDYLKRHEAAMFHAIKRRIRRYQFKRNNKRSKS